jgi:hypothetical protein
MVVGNEDVAECGQWHPGAGQRDGDAVAAVNDVGTLLTMITCDDAKLLFRGRGPPPVPSRMSRVLTWAGDCAVAREGFVTASASSAPALEMNCRREESHMFTSDS